MSKVAEALRTLPMERKIAVVVAILLIGCGGLWVRSRMTKHAPDVTTFEVKREEFLDVLQLHGQVKSLRSVSITAPADAGDLEVVKIAVNGSHLNKGDMVVEFDRSKTEQQLAQYRSTLKSSQAEIDQERAQDVLKEEEDKTAVMKAEFDVETAKLEASKQEIVSKIEGAEAQLKLADAEQKLNEMQVKLKADLAQDKAAVESKGHASRKAAYDAETAGHALAGMTLTAPSSGMVSLTPVWHGGGGQTPFKAGDRAWPGAPIAELPDTASLRVSGRVDETERGRLALRQTATILFDAIPDRQFTGKVEEIGTIATLDFSASWPFPLDFNLQIVLDQDDARLKPGMSAQATVVVDRVPDAITIPEQAMFQRSGQTVVYVWDNTKFREQTIVIGRTSHNRILVIKGLNAGDRVALKDPTGKE